MKPKENIRERLIDRQRRRLSMPRFQMTLILSLTGFSGFLTSFLLLRAGVEQMWMRYPLAISAAYVAFLLTLRLWLALQLSQGTAAFGGNPNLPPSAVDSGMNFDLSVGGASAADSPDANFSFGGGGDFGGAGAGGDWESDGSRAASLTSGGGGIAFASTAQRGGSASNGVDIDSEELGMLILAVVAVIGGLLATFYVIYIAPALLAEILVDGLLVGGLHKRVKDIERKHWLQTALWKTLLPALLCVILFGVAGMALQIAAPNATSIGEVWREVRTVKTPDK